MKITASVFGLLVVLIVGWSQREYIGTELGITSGSGATLQIDTSRIVTRRVWAGPGVDLSGSPSPDGALLSHTDWTTGDLALRNLATGESRHLTNKGPWSESEAMTLSSVISRDGQQVAYMWVPGGTRWETRVIGIDGAGERVVVHGPGQPYDWSPDGRDILVSLVDTTGGNRLGLVSAEGGRSAAWRRSETAEVLPERRSRPTDDSWCSMITPRVVHHSPISTSSRQMGVGAGL